ncbi:type II and III secretion system protein family protein [Geoanaerobacter pelophilus]|uniref:type II and III secretion system protein family protein n=1 Tax=Geoanaerobacter pelophilus TaxID=60036 RepID=UPI000A2679F3|nr:pilus assembly protein N-terminal domain-containing protein [Geoanaerobacter pelophilus]
MRCIPSKPCLAFVLFCLCLLFGAATAKAGVPTTVIVNRGVVLNLKNPARYINITDKDVIDVPDPLRRNQLLINGKKIGSTNLIVWEENNDKPTFFDVRVVGDREAIESQIREYAPKDDINVQYAQDTVVLSGKVANEMTGKKAEEIAKAYSAKVLNHITVDEPQQVLLQVKVAQVDRTSLKRLGISAMVKGRTAEGFLNLVGAPSGTSSVTNSSPTRLTSTEGTGIAGNIPGLGSFDPLDAFNIGVSYFPAGIGAVLQALSSKGLAKILAEPNLLVKSGEEGNFLAGSRIPYSVLISTGGASTSSIVFETVGVKLKFKPQVLQNGLINLKIDPAEVSSIAGTLAVNGYPIIDTRDVRTDVELRDGESLVLAGLLQEEQIKNMSKIPLLGDIPILGALFRSSQKDIREKDLVFFITPKIVKATPPGVATRLPTDLVVPKEEKEYDWIPLGRK